MTYNFDPDQWAERQARYIDKRFRDGQISETERDAELAALDRRLLELWQRLDSSYRIPS